MSHPAGTGASPAALHRLVGLGPPLYDRDGLEAATGVEAERGRRWWRALGFPEAPDDEVIFGDDDADMIRRLADLERAGLIDEADVLRLARLNGAMFSRLAEAQVSTMDYILASQPGLSDSDSPRDRLRAFVRSGDSDMLTTFEESILYVWRRHLLAAMGRWLGAETATSDAAVGFGDLARFTKVTSALEPDELASLVENFEAACFDVVSGSGARVVKLIGDEVMFIASTLPLAVEIGLDLIDRLGAISGMPELRCGVAFGPTVGVGGDVFGSTVNLAARLTAVARPGAVMIPREDSDAFDDRDDVLVRPVRRRYDLPGIGRVPLAVVRRLEPPDDDPPGEVSPDAGSPREPADADAADHDGD